MKMSKFKSICLVLLFFSSIYSSYEHNHTIYAGKNEYMKFNGERIYDSVSKRYVYNQGCYNVHDAQLQRLHKLLKILEIELEKLYPNSFEIRRSQMNLLSIFDKYPETQKRKELPADFRGIFKALHRLNNSMVCPCCKLRALGIIEENKNKVKIFEQKDFKK